ncbi:nucleotide exchange factor GrpE [Candidatus Riesia pediculicola]|uniref:Protein GrpE n=1 Tax=Riesia pediculicola (strain USDA) TaxID=515618 RepID=D4G8B3_RIEPU|nr:nucleotide exchange factor GrpE [Candidatus Riesia pediculicola]ADD79585.1 co-chaperone GrpE [Candidatus Riesia pediculicola USDA]ARC53807.1 hypothetical protein AOE55_01420 [Candidatus Riesia pediculicola]QOJ86441.1 nucleotide exchange factor GrpE [Candidatus Riesia pediculicola]
MDTIKECKNHDNEKIFKEEIEEKKKSKKNDFKENSKESDLNKEKELLRSEIKRLKDKIDSYKKREREIILRSKAEIENIRRRNEKSFEKAHKFALEKFSYDLLSVIDNLERAILLEMKEEKNFSSMLDGIQLTIRSFLSVIEKYGICPVLVQKGESFDPKLHEAVSTVNSKEYDHNQIVDIVQKGYTIHNRLLRPTMVIVNSKDNLKKGKI